MNSPQLPKEKPVKPPKLPPRFAKGPMMSLTALLRARPQKFN